MGSRRRSAWQQVVALAPLLLLLAVYLPGQMMMRCRMDGLLRPVCCCPQDSGAQDNGPVVKAQDCCDRELAINQRPVVAPARVSAGEVEWAMAMSMSRSAAVAVLAVAEPDQSCRRFGRIQSDGPPADGPPIVLLKHAFLI